MPIVPHSTSRKNYSLAENKASTMTAVDNRRRVQYGLACQRDINLDTSPLCCTSVQQLSAPLLSILFVAIKNKMGVSNYGTTTPITDIASTVERIECKE